MLFKSVRMRLNKGRIAYTRYAVWDRDACQSAASVECLIADACPPGDYHLFQGFGDTSSIIRIIQRAEDIAEMRRACAVSFLTDKRDCYSCQAAASGECPTADACHAVGNRYVCQSAASVECIRGDACHAVGNCYACQRDAAIERTIANACHAVGNSHGRQTAATIEDMISYARQAVGNRDACQVTAIFKSSPFYPNHRQAVDLVGDLDRGRR